MPSARSSRRHQRVFEQPANPMEAQRCYALRELMGRKADDEFNLRRKACAVVGMAYNWSAYYDHVGVFREKKHGVDLGWWRSMARYTVDRKTQQLPMFLVMVPEKYRANIEELARQAFNEKVEAAQKASGVSALVNAQPPPPINHGPSGQPKVEVEKANVPDQPKSDELSDYYVEPSRVPPRLQEPVNEEVDKNSVPYVNHPYQIPDAPEWSNTPSPW